MAILNRDDFFNRVNAMIGTDTSDDSMAFIEDMTDTYNDMESRANGDGIDWKARYDELDKSWRDKYKRRFFSTGGYSNYGGAREEEENSESDRAEKITINDLFK